MFEPMDEWRVLHVITTISRGGAENHLFDLVRHQRAAGMEVTVAYLQGGGYWTSAYHELGVDVHDLALRRYGDPAPVWKLRRVVRGSAPQLVHAHMPPAELYCRLALAGISRRRLPLVISKHNEEPFYKGPGQKLMGRWVARRASAVIAISEAVYRYVTGPNLGIDPSRMHTIYYGIDARPFCDARREAGLALRRQWGVPEGALLVGFVGRLVPQKSPETLLEGFALTRQQSGLDPWLVIVGEGELETSLRRQAEQLGIADRVVWAGFNTDIPAVMRAFDIFALTSVYEGFGLVLAEAMASRLPIVATRAGSIPEIVVDGETGFLIRPREPRELAAALHHLSDESLRARLGEAGQRRVLGEFTLARMFRESDELYAQLRSRSSGEIRCPAGTV